MESFEREERIRSHASGMPTEFIRIINQMEMAMPAVGMADKSATLAKLHAQVIIANASAGEYRQHAAELECFIADRKSILESE